MTSTWWGGFLYAFLLLAAFVIGYILGMVVALTNADSKKSIK